MPFCTGKKSQQKKQVNLDLRCGCCCCCWFWNFNNLIDLDVISSLFIPNSGFPFHWLWWRCLWSAAAVILFVGFVSDRGAGGSSFHATSLVALVNQNAMMQCAKRSVARKAWELMGEDLPATDGQTLEVRKPQNRRTERFYMRFRSSGITQKLKLEHDEATVTLHRIGVVGVVLSGAKNFHFFRGFPLPDEAGYVVEIEQSAPCKTTNTHYCNTLCVDWGWMIFNSSIMCANQVYWSRKWPSLARKIYGPEKNEISSVGCFPIEWWLPLGKQKCDEPKIFININLLMVLRKRQTCKKVV